MSKEPIKPYVLCVYTYHNTVTTRDPSTYELSCSDDGVIYNTISSGNFSFNSNIRKKRIQITNPTKATNFKLSLTGLGGDTANEIDIGEIYLYGST